jgi:hypothetical protein
MKLAFILTKLQKEEELTEEDWIHILQLCMMTFSWIVKNTEVKVTQISSQAHLQPKQSLKKKKKSQR